MFAESPHFGSWSSFCTCHLHISKNDFQRVMAYDAQHAHCNKHGAQSRYWFRAANPIGPNPTLTCFRNWWSSGFTRCISLSIITVTFLAAQALHVHAWRLHEVVATDRVSQIESRNFSLSIYILKTSYLWEYARVRFEVAVKPNILLNLKIWRAKYVVLSELLTALVFSSMSHRSLHRLLIVSM